MKHILQRGLGLLKTGNAIRNIRKSSDEESRLRASQYLMEILGQSRGLPTKVGQFLSMDSQHSALSDVLQAATPPMEFEEVLERIDEAYGHSHKNIFKSLEPTGKPASLGQVHFGKLLNGQPVAVKVQYPGIADSVEAELKIFGWMPKAGPVSRWGFDLESYRETFHENFTRELDYLLEARQQERYRELCGPLPNVIVPEVFMEYCRPTVLVQSRQTGLSLEEVEGLSESDRKGFGRAILNHYVTMIFRHSCVHSDPNPGNFAFRKGDPESLILYDFGSVLNISEAVRTGLVRSIIALQEREPVDPAACLAALGFDVEKLNDLRPTLPALMQVLFDPFTQQGPYDTRGWKISERFDGIVGELKWWFRSAAPAELIFLMRTLHGLTNLLNRLKVALPWRWTLETQCGDLLDDARNQPLPAVPERKSAPTFRSLSQFLKVYVVKSNGNKVELAMPSRVADQLENVIDPPVMESIRRQNIDLEEIQKRVQRTGFQPQELFEVKDDQRHVRVWLE